MTIDQLQIEIEALPNEAFSRLRQWFAEKDWERWDQQVESDEASGRLNFLIEEALAAKQDGLICAGDQARISVPLW